MQRRPAIVVALGVLARVDFRQPRLRRGDRIPQHLVVVRPQGGGSGQQEHRQQREKAGRRKAHRHKKGDDLVIEQGGAFWECENGPLSCFSRTSPAPTRSAPTAICSILRATAASCSTPACTRAARG